MCGGGSKKAAPKPQAAAPKPQTEYDYSNGAIRTVTPTKSTDGQMATFGSELSGSATGN